MVVVVVARSAHKARRRALDRPRRRTQRAARAFSSSTRATTASRLAFSPATTSRDGPRRRCAAGAARLLRAPRHKRPGLAAHRDAARRRARQRRSTACAHGSVTDFIKLPLGWPPFNLADASITLGMCSCSCSSIIRRHVQTSIADAACPHECSRNPAPFTIAYQDEHLLVVDKAAGLVVHPARGHREGTLSQLLEPHWRAAASQSARGIVHRLDRDTSGLLVVARTEEAHRLLQAGAAQAADRARVHRARGGSPAARTGTIEAPIGRDPRVRTRMAVGGALRARSPHSLHARARARGTSRCCACAWRPGAPTRSACTCRRSAIRCAAIPSTALPGLLGLERQFLHATRLAFEHPITGERVEVHSPLPADLRDALERAEGGR